MQKEKDSENLEKDLLSDELDNPDPDPNQDPEEDSEEDPDDQDLDLEEDPEDKEEVADLLDDQDASYRIDVRTLGVEELRYLPTPKAVHIKILHAVKDPIFSAVQSTGSFAPLIAVKKSLRDNPDYDGFGPELCTAYWMRRKDPKEDNYGRIAVFENTRIKAIKARNEADRAAGVPFDSFSLRDVAAEVKYRWVNSKKDPDKKYYVPTEVEIQGYVFNMMKPALKLVRLKKSSKEADVELEDNLARLGLDPSLHPEYAAFPAEKVKEMKLVSGVPVAYQETSMMCCKNGTIITTSDTTVMNKLKNLCVKYPKLFRLILVEKAVTKDISPNDPKYEDSKELTEITVVSFIPKGVGIKAGRGRNM